jgi:hypothetical protein
VAATAVLATLVVAAAACSGAGRADQTTVTTRPAPATTTTEAPLTAGRQVTTYVPTVGDCYDNRTVGAGATATMVVLLLPCTLPHQNEVFEVLQYPVTPAFPGTGVLEAYAKTLCVGAFEAYVGKPYETSKFGLAYELPAEPAWGNGIHHAVGCLLVDPNGGRLVGSARNSKQ